MNGVAPRAAADLAHIDFLAGRRREANGGGGNFAPRLEPAGAAIHVGCVL